MEIGIYQKQQQIISQELFQIMELIEIPTIELKNKLEEEAEKNPVIKLEYKKDKNKDWFRKKLNKGYNSQLFLENISNNENNIYFNILTQLDYMGATEREKKIAELIISGLNSNGFLKMNPNELIQNSDITIEEFEKVRNTIMKLDPIGVGCYDHVEFLKLQIKTKYGEDSLEYKIIDKYPDLIMKKHYSKIAKLLNVSFEQIQESVENIKKLNWLPIINNDKELPHYVIPDAFVKVLPDGKIDIILNDEYIPEVKITTYYLNLTSKENKDSIKLKDNERRFLKDSIESARRLIEILNTRKEIIYKVILKIIEKQKDYFLKGPQYQVPLKIKDIANEIGYDESTISRVVKNRYIQTDKGIILLKNFFSTNVGDENTSAKSIKYLIQEIINSEDKENPLSDEKIAMILKKNKGINVSRRTINKYREELNIPPAFIRKKPK